MTPIMKQKTSIIFVGGMTMNDNNELVVNREQANEMCCDLDEIKVHDAAAMHEATGMWFVIKNGHIIEIYD